MFAREGYPFILGAAAIAAIGFAMALRLRSWPLWLAAIALTIIALWVAWFFRNPTRLGERGANVASVTARRQIVLLTNIDVAVVDAVRHGTRIGAGRFAFHADLLRPTKAQFRETLRRRTMNDEAVFADLALL